MVETLQIGHFHIEACIFIHATAFTQSCNYDFGIYDVVKVATQACILQNVLLNLVPFNVTFEKLKKMCNLNVFSINLPLHAFRYLFIAPFRRNHTPNLQVYKCLVYTFVDRILTRSSMRNRRKLPNIAEIYKAHLQWRIQKFQQSVQRGRNFGVWGLF